MYWNTGQTQNRGIRSKKTALSQVSMGAISAQLVFLAAISSLLAPTECHSATEDFHVSMKCYFRENL